MRTGDLVADRFRIDQTAGAGGMGTVYRATDLQDGVVVALKVLREASEDHVRRFAKEAEVLHRIRHPRVVRYVAHGRTADGHLFLAMEWLDGLSLSQHLKRHSLSLQEAYRLCSGLAEAVAVAHEHGVLHRDIKPANIWLVEGDTARVKLIDFGLARAELAAQAMTQTGELLGTPGYMAPEQARGNRDLDARADVFSLGCVMFRCLSGRRAFEGDDALAVLAKLVLETPPRLGALMPGFPPRLDALVARSLAKNRGDRPSDGTAVLRELLPLEEEVQAALGLERPPTGGAELLPSITIKEQRVMCLVLARLVASMSGEQEAEHLRLLQASVHPFGGKLDRLIDGTLLVTVHSGAPAEQAARAARCALAMRGAIGAAPIALAAGRGMVAQGALLGEAIDRAAALLALGASDVIRVDEAAAALMRSRFDVRRDDHGFVLRGVQGEDDHTRRLLGRPTKCVGRTRELSNLEALFEECVSEPVARAVLVTAPAGVGKSRLRFEFLKRLIERGTVENEEGDRVPFQVWLGRGDPMSAGAAFGMISGALRQAMGIRIGEDLALRRRKLLARVARRVPAEQQRRVAEFLGELVGTPFDDGESVQLRAARHDAVVMGDQMRRAFEDFLAAEGRHLPLLIILEDLHWGDLPSVSFIDAALRNLAEHPLMVVAFARPEVHDSFPGIWAEREVQELRLSRLTRKASAKLVRQVLGDEASEQLVERLVDRAEGNAFYLEELIRAVAEGKGEQLPESVLAMVQSRLEALDSEARRVLRGASVFGQVFWRGGVQTLIGEKRAADLDDWLADLEERELIFRRPESRFPGEVELGFRHALLREAAYAALTENDRELGHRLAGRWLEGAGEGEGVVLAEHFERGSDAARAARWYVRAAEQALEGNDLEAAVARAERGFACGARGDMLGKLRLVQADAHRWRGEFEAMEERAIVAMENLPRGESLWCRAVADVAVACRAQSHYDRLLSVADELSRLTPLSHFEAAYTEAVARTAMQLFIIGWAQQGDGLIARVEKASAVLANTHPGVVAWIDHARSFGALYLGDAGRYLELSEQAGAKFEQAGDLRGVANSQVHRGFGYLQVGAYQEAEIALREALSSAQRMGLFNVVATALNNLGMALARLGQLDEAVVVESEAIRLASRQGDRRIEGASRHYLALIHLLRDERSLAEREAESAAEDLRVAPPLRAHALATLAQARLMQGRTALALEASREAMKLLESLGGIEEGEAAVRLVHAEALRAAGDDVGARRAVGVAGARLSQRALQITDPNWRASFLENIPENARTLRLAEEWLPDAELELLEQSSDEIRAAIVSATSRTPSDWW